MKKQANVLLTLTALLTLTSFAPKTFWQESEVLGRFPASEEEREETIKLLGSDLADSNVQKIEKGEIEKLQQRRLEDIEKLPTIKVLEAQDLEIKPIDKAIFEKLPEVKVAMEEIKSVPSIVECKADEPDLKKEINELVEKNEKLLSQLDELKKDKADKKERREKFEAKLPKYAYSEFKESDYSSNYLSMMMMSQMTSLMYSQQQQQAEMMSQMFTLMTQMSSGQQQQQNRLTGLEPYYNRFSVIPSQESFHSQAPLRLSDYGIGIGRDYNTYNYYNEPRNRMPTSMEHGGVPHQRGEHTELKPAQPQYTSPVVHEGFNFSGTSMADFTRGQI